METVWAAGALSRGICSVDTADKIVTSSFGLIVVFLRHTPDLPLYQDELFERLIEFLKSLDLSLCRDQVIGAGWLTPPNCRLKMPLSSHIKWTMILAAFY